MRADESNKLAYIGTWGKKAIQGGYSRKDANHDGLRTEQFMLHGSFLITPVTATPQHKQNSVQPLMGTEVESD